jgi:hypothetical protein
MNRERAALSIFASMCVGVTSACSDGQAQVGASAAPSPFVIRFHGDRILFDTPAQMCVASVVLDATVGRHGAAHWNTASGALPQGAGIGLITTQGFDVYIPIAFSGERALLDNRTQPNHEFATVGGTLGLISDQTGLPELLPGQRYLAVFVPGHRPLSPQPDYSTLIAIDAFQIDGHANVLFPRSQQTAAGRDITAPPKAVPLVVLAQQLSRCPHAS